MSRVAWRIATDAPTYQATDLSGTGARSSGGRWNTPGVAVVYASTSRALACLETVVHLNGGGLPLNRYLVSLTIPDAVWEAARQESVASLPVGWDAEPAGQTSLQFGTEWVRAGETALLLVPSVIVPEELNVLINPGHRDSLGIGATKLRRWLYDPRLVRSA